LEAVEREELVARAESLGSWLGARLSELADRHALLRGQRGQGLLQALVLGDGVDPRLLMEKLREAGVLLTVAGGVALRFTPPLTIDQAELEEALHIVDRVLGELT
jgi:acetylornithine/succinyldiaminopimelate/putrescine aminotransferase